AEGPGQGLSAAARSGRVVGCTAVGRRRTAQPQRADRVRAARRAAQGRALAAGRCTPGPGGGQAMSRRWQYRIHEIKPKFLGLKAVDIEEELSRLGQQGWELVSVVQTGMLLRCYLKKEL